MDEKSEHPDPRVVKESVGALVRTADQLIVGQLHVRPKKRLKDELNVISEHYIAITEARVYNATGGDLLYTASVLLVSTAHIVTVTPLDAISESPGAIWRRLLSR